MTPRERDLAKHAARYAALRVEYMCDLRRIFKTPAYLNAALFAMRCELDERERNDVAVIEAYYAQESK